MNGEFITRSPEETHALGFRLGQRLAALPGPVVIAYTGGLGAGKTAFTGGIAQALGIRDRVTSPTFAIVNEYEGIRRLCHFDMYRLSSPEDLESIGWFDYLLPGVICAVEWSENVAELLPADCIRVDISRGAEDNLRIITLSGLPRTEGEADL
ncbi:MAG: tRNA (adenosine(37)-N6)-threonylcarbamoyltransferase complex ATPase subunit type 1 TsaE [Clostridia bacterium]|nr:tRNA (adenosine(37)-N6)-threonylcarbamoyltransferase complex ATPase subunit type 1 TsaE [Clostridia bacterium]